MCCEFLTMVVELTRWYGMELGCVWWILFDPGCAGFYLAICVGIYLADVFMVDAVNRF